MDNEQKVNAGESRGKYGIPSPLNERRRIVPCPTHDELLRCVVASGITTAGGDING